MNLLYKRSFHFDTIAMAGWLLLLFTGQSIINFKSPILEGIAILWMVISILCVRKTMCIPFLILCYPAFMCENHRENAYLLMLFSLLLLMRILIENRHKYSLRNYLLIFLGGVITLFLSWPEKSENLILRLIALNKKEFIKSFLAPEAVWAIFPFRQAFDRALITMLCIAVGAAKEYFSTPKIWFALWIATIMALFQAYSGIIIPWHLPHRFLGTSNYGVYEYFLFHGAGYSIHFLSIIIAIGIPFFFFPDGKPIKYIKYGTTVLIIPAIIYPQKALIIALTAFILTCGVLALSRLKNFTKRYSLITFATNFITGLLSFGLVFSWIYEAKTIYPLSRHFKRQIKEHRILKRIIYNKESSEITTKQKQETENIQKPFYNRYTSFLENYNCNIFEKWLFQQDKARGEMWIIGFRTIIKECIILGKGAGTWARFHRDSPRLTRQYFAHMHNSYLDFAFEYGILCSIILFILIILTLILLLKGKFLGGKFWLVYYVSVGCMALGQYLLFAFSTSILLIPMFILTYRTGKKILTKNINMTFI